MVPHQWDLFENTIVCSYGSIPTLGFSFCWDLMYLKSWLGSCFMFWIISISYACLASLMACVTLFLCCAYFWWSSADLDAIYFFHASCLSFTCSSSPFDHHRVFYWKPFAVFSGGTCLSILSWSHGSLVFFLMPCFISTHVLKVTPIDIPYFLRNLGIIIFFEIPSHRFTSVHGCFS